MFRCNIINFFFYSRLAEEETRFRKALDIARKALKILRKTLAPLDENPLQAVGLNMKKKIIPLKKNIYIYTFSSQSNDDVYCKNQIRILHL